MVGTTYQLITLVTYGNAFLESLDYDIGDFYPAHTAFMFCKEISFVDVVPGENGGIHELTYAQDPVAWFIRLKEERYTKLILRYRPAEGVDSNGLAMNDRMLSAFVGGGGEWTIEAVRGDVHDTWVAKWGVNHEEDPKDHTWSVTYGRIERDVSEVSRQSEPLESIARDLAAVLMDIKEFADKHNLSGFSDCFGRALECLMSTEVPKTHLVPPHFLPDQATRLIAAADAAWVFGGMGSWNDMGFEGEEQERYETLSDTLFSMLNHAIVSAVNSKE